jgi:dTDP-4-amino-4,6-dideoxygalactose transaminase
MKRQCPVSASVADRIVRLPLYYSLSQQDQETVVKAVLEFRAS